MAEWRKEGDEGRVGLLLGRSVAGVKEKVLVRINRVVMGNVLKWRKRRKPNVWHLGPCLWQPPSPSPNVPLVPLLVQIIQNNLSFI